VTRAALLFAAVLIGGCGFQILQGPREPERYFILEAPAGVKAKTALELEPTSAATFYDTQDMVYSRAPGTRAYYQYNHWTERPPRAIQAQLASRFEEPSNGKGLLLRTRVDEIYHDAAKRPGTARITLSAQLVDASGTVLAQRAFTASAPAASYDAAGATRGFDQALGMLLDDIVHWVDAQPPR
jgi:cholesterol transport system auxiliary component